MLKEKKFIYDPHIIEYEKATSSYLMSFVALLAGLPLPIFNLIATLIFYLSNKKNTLFIRWHCFQALLSQLFLFVFNSFAFWWTVQIIFNESEMTNLYLSYLFVVIILNLIEFVTTIIISVKISKYKHLEWWLLGDIINLFLRDEIEKYNS